MTNSQMRRFALIVESFLSIIPPILLPGLVKEIISRAVATVASIGRDYNTGIEDRVRGVLYASTFNAKGLRIGRGVRLDGKSKIKLSDNVTLHGPLYISATSASGNVNIGEHTHIDRTAVLYGQGGLDIGSECAIAAGVIIYSQTNQYDDHPGMPVVQQGTKYAKVEIGKDVWIGAGAIILPGVKVGSHSVIGAGSVVTKDVCEASIVVGSPAKEIKKREGYL